MTVIAFDGVTMAADRLFVSAGLRDTGTKIYKLDNGALVGFSNSPSYGLTLVDWYRRGAKHQEYPESQRDESSYTPLLVAKLDPVLGVTIDVYESTYFPIRKERKFWAIGCGRDYAMAAMECGRNAWEAVDIACRLDANCGGGIDTLVLGRCLTTQNDLNTHVTEAVQSAFPGLRGSP